MILINMFIGIGSVFENNKWVIKFILWYGLVLFFLFYCIICIGFMLVLKFNFGIVKFWSFYFWVFSLFLLKCDMG